MQQRSEHGQAGPPRLEEVLGHVAADGGPADDDDLVGRGSVLSYLREEPVEVFLGGDQVQLVVFSYYGVAAGNQIVAFPQDHGYQKGLA